MCIDRGMYVCVCTKEIQDRGKRIEGKCLWWLTDSDAGKYCHSEWESFSFKYQNCHFHERRPQHNYIHRSLNHLVEC